MLLLRRRLLARAPAMSMLERAFMRRCCRDDKYAMLICIITHAYMIRYYMSFYASARALPLSAVPDVMLLLMLLLADAAALITPLMPRYMLRRAF